MICARILKEHEEKIREEYDRILSTKLNGKILSLKLNSIVFFSSPSRTI